MQEYDEWCRKQAGAEREVFDQAYSRELFDGIINRISDHESKTAEPEPVTRKRYVHYIKWAAAAVVTGAAFMMFNTIKLKRREQQSLKRILAGKWGKTGDGDH